MPVFYIRKYLLALAVGLWSFRVLAQAPTFDRALAFPNPTALGGSEIKQTVADAQGNTYVVGTFGSSLNLGGTILYSAGGSDVVVAKLNPAGGVVWAVSGGGSTTDYGRGIGLDAAGNIYITGIFSGPSARFGATTLTGSSTGIFDVYVARLSAAGSWQWAVSGGGPGTDYAQALAVDAAGNVCITGSFGGSSAVFGSSTLLNTSSLNTADVFVARLSAAGAWQWAVSGGGPGTDNAEALTLDGGGTLYLTGSTNSSSATFGSLTLTRSGLNAGLLVASLTAAGSWQWASSSNGNGSAAGLGIGVDAVHNAYVTGYFSNTVTFGTAQLVSRGSADIVVARFDSYGNVVWATAGGGTGPDMGQSLTLDGAGSVYVGASFSSPTATLGSRALVSAGSFDVLVARLNAAGAWQEAVRGGGTGPDYVQHLTTGFGGFLYLSGNFAEAPADFGAVRLINNSGTLPTGFQARLTTTALATSPARPAPALLVWPNPGRGVVQLSGPEAGQLTEVFNATGSRVATYVQPSHAPLTLTLPSGFYVVRSQGKSQRLVVE